MWLAECPRCERRRLYGAEQVRAIGNLAPGLIAVTLACSCGETIALLTGRRVTGPDDRLPAARP